MLRSVSPRRTTYLRIGSGVGCRRVGCAVTLGVASTDGAEALGDGEPKTAGSRSSATPSMALHATTLSRVQPRRRVAALGGGATAAREADPGWTGGLAVSARPTREVGCPSAGGRGPPKVERIEEVSWRPTGSPGRVQLRHASAEGSQQLLQTNSPQRWQKR
ncbi:MAG TPA: hypothetical protein VH859_09280 [Candidatus Limnocylindria bacterium]